MIKEVYHDGVTKEDIKSLNDVVYVNKVVLFKDKAVTIIRNRKKSTLSLPITKSDVKKEKPFYIVNEYFKDKIEITSYYLFTEEFDYIIHEDEFSVRLHYNDIIGQFNFHNEDITKSYDLDAYRFFMTKNNLLELFAVFDENQNRLNEVQPRGNKSQEGKYIKIVFVWIKNKKNEYLIQKRSDIKTLPGLWSTTGGGLLNTDKDSLTCAIRETKEEVGITLNESDGRVITTVFKDNVIIDVFMFDCDVSINDIVIQEDEVSAVSFVSKKKLLKMQKNKTFYSQVNIMDMKLI